MAYLSPIQEAVCAKLADLGARSEETAAWPGGSIPIQSAIRKLVAAGIVAQNKAGQAWLVEPEGE